MKLFAALPRLWHLWLGGLIVLVLGMGIDVMEVDSAQYASIAREMLHNGEWLEVYEHGQTYNSRGFPDKPPLLFWAGAVGMWLIGENNWGFKLLAILSSLIGIFAAGRWSALLYGEKAKLPARLFYAFNAGFVLMNQDLRTDAMLVNFILLACWQLELYLRTQSKRAFLLTFTCVALGMLAKGPVALIAVLAAFGPDAVVRRDWKRLFRPEWLLGIVLILTLLGPMLYGLYTQWGWEKGIKYYFWTQSFGRITGENVWQNNLPVTFLLENFAWTFLPWVPLFGAMLFFSIKHKFSCLKGAGKAVPAFGFVLMLTAMSMSKYKLPHYVFVCWPFAAVWLAGWWNQARLGNAWHAVHTTLGALMSLFTCFLAYWTLGWSPLVALLPFLCWFVIVVTTRKMHFDIPGAMHSMLWGLLLFEAFAVIFFYPWLLDHQSSSKAGQAVAQMTEQLPLFFELSDDESIHALHFYSHQVAQKFPSAITELPRQFLLYTKEATLVELKNNPNVEVSNVQVFDYFAVTHLTPSFLNAKTRASQVEKRFLLTINKQ